MITECYIKGRFDYGLGKCAVVITEDSKVPQDKVVLHKVAWKVPEQWDYKGEIIEADQYNCEILAATYALQWCMQHNKEVVNIYANTKTAQKWYLLGEIPETRKMKQAYVDTVCQFNEHFNKMNSDYGIGRIYADYIPKSDDNKFNKLVNTLAVNIK